MLPQLRMMQKAKVVEKFTAHYVFALGASRFVSCAHWVLQVRAGVFGGRRLAPGRGRAACCAGVTGRRCAASQPSQLALWRDGSRRRTADAVACPCPPPQIMDGDKYLWQALGSGIWPIMVLLSEIVQTFILADFW